jgi:hypothetical protein
MLKISFAALGLLMTGMSPSAVQAQLLRLLYLWQNEHQQGDLIAQGARSEVACETLPFAGARIALSAHDENVHRFFTIDSP